MPMTNRTSGAKSARGKTASTSKRGAETRAVSIEDHKAGMYKGQRISRVVSADSGTAGDQLVGGSATLTTTLSKAEA